MSIAESRPVLKYDSIVVSQRGISEIDARREIVFVAAAEIEEITLKFGRSAHSPLTTLCIGSALLLVGFWGLAAFLESPAGFRYEIGAMGMGAIGGSLIFDTLKKRYFFEVRAKGQARRLVLSKRAQLSELVDFCSQVEEKYELRICRKSLLGA